MDDQGAKALGGVLATLGLIFWKVVLPAISSWATKKFLKGDPGEVAPKQLPTPDKPPQPVLVPSLPPVSKKYIEELTKVAQAMGEWTLDEARRRVRELERDLEEVSSDQAKTAQRLAGANYENERLTAENAQLRVQLAQAHREVESANRRAGYVAAELTEAKRQGQASHSTRDHVVTPIRPPKKV